MLHVAHNGRRQHLRLMGARSKRIVLLQDGIGIDEQVVGSCLARLFIHKLQELQALLRWTMFGTEEAGTLRQRAGVDLGSRAADAGGVELEHEGAVICGV